jgi:hypothetical protein
MINIEKLGFDNWFQDKVDFEICHIATVAALDSVE